MDISVDVHIYVVRNWVDLFFRDMAEDSRTTSEQSEPANDGR